jgi:1,4-dihydroxy-2-naphthoate octaprenyltransferase
MIGLNILCGLALTLLYQRWLALPLILIGLGLLWMYSYPPFKLSYRGGGELLQMLGVGMVLPIIGYYAQTGKIIDFSWLLFLTILPTQLACAIATSLPDEPSDRVAGKKTASVLLGSHTTKIAVIVLNYITIIVFPWVAWLEPGDIFVWQILTVPILTNTVLCLFIRSQPGSIKLNIFTLFAVLVTLSMMSGMAVAAFYM